MLTKNLFQNRDWVKPEAQACAKPSSQAQRARTKTKRSHLFCFYLLANMLVWNAVYGLYTADKDKPILGTIAADNVICKLWQKYPLISSKPLQKGTITGILYSREKPAAMVNTEIIYEGTVIHNIKVIRIGPKKVEFEKNGRVWAQAMHGTPDSAWQDF